MAAGLALTKADVTLPDGQLLKGVSVLVRRGQAQARQSRQLLADTPGVEAVSPTGRRSWAVRFADGTEWQVSRVACGPCSGRR